MGKCDHAVAGNEWCPACEHELSNIRVLPSGTPTERIASVRRVLREHAMAVIDGTLVDVQSANAVCVVYDGLSTANQVKFAAMSAGRMGEVAWKLVE